MKVYLIGSLKNPEIPKIGIAIRALGFDVFDDWWGAGPNADDCWQEYEMIRGRDYGEALYGAAAKNIFQFDQKHLDESDIGVLVLPAGKSGHLEFGYLLGRKKRGYILFPEEPERWDVMNQFATDVFFDIDDLLQTLESVRPFNA